MCPESVGAREQLEEVLDLVVHECTQAVACSSLAASKASSVRIEYTSAAPALMETATPRASAISSLPAPCLRAAAVWTAMQPSHRKLTATASAINSRVLAPRRPVFSPAPPRAA